MSREIICRYCKKPFIQSRYHPKQHTVERRSKRGQRFRRIIEFFIYPLIRYLDEGIKVR